MMAMLSVAARKQSSWAGIHVLYAPITLFVAITTGLRKIAMPTLHPGECLGIETHHYAFPFVLTVAFLTLTMFGNLFIGFGL